MTSAARFFFYSSNLHTSCSIWTHAQTQAHQYDFNRENWTCSYCKWLKSLSWCANGLSHCHDATWWTPGFAGFFLFISYCVSYGHRLILRITRTWSFFNHIVLATSPLHWGHVSKKNFEGTNIYVTLFSFLISALSACYCQIQFVPCYLFVVVLLLFQKIQLKASVQTL